MRFGWHLQVSILLPLEAQLPRYWVPVLKSLYQFSVSITQGPTIWVPGLLGSVAKSVKRGAFRIQRGHPSIGQGLEGSAGYQIWGPPPGFP